MKKYNFENWNEKLNHFCEWSHIKSKLIYSSKKIDIPDISVMIPTYNRTIYLKESIDSVLNQHFSGKYNIIVVDNCSEDESVSQCMEHYCQKYDNILYYRNDENIGMTGNWNRCIELAKSKWMVILHDDDMMKENYLEIVYSIAQKSHCTFAGVFQEKLVQIPENKNQGKAFNRGLANAQKILNFLRNGKPFLITHEDVFQYVSPSAGCWFMDKDFSMKLGGYNAEYDGGLDTVFNLRHAWNGKSIIIPQFLMVRRVADNATLKDSLQLNTVGFLYGLGNYFLQNCRNRKKYKKILDISTVYMAYGIKKKYNGKFEVKNILSKLGVDEKILKMNYYTIYFLNAFLLAKLIFRKDVCK